MLFEKLALTDLTGFRAGRRTLNTLLACGGLALTACQFASPAGAQTLPVLTVTGVSNDTGSAKIMYTPIAGAQDYRVYDVTDPSKVKYAGQWHITAGWCGWNLSFERNADGSLVYPLTTMPGAPGQSSPELVTVPAWEVEWNGVQPGHQETLVVEAVDQAGPVPSGNLYSGTTNAALEPCTDGMCMVGSNAGITLDGNYSTNGQGASTNTPHVIARSLPFVVGTTASTLPQMQGSSVFEPFSTATIQKSGPVDNEFGNESYSLQGNQPWQTIVQGADVAHSNAFVDNGHFMDVLFDGGTPGLSSIGMHNNHASLALTPVKTVEIGEGHILHVTYEVDAHMDGRRWCGIAVYPYNSTPSKVSFVETDFTNVLNDTNRGIMFQTPGNQMIVTQLLGLTPTGAGIASTDQNYQRPQLFGPTLTPVLSGPSGYQPTTTGQQYNMSGHGLDDRTRFDVFLSYNHFQAYEDGVKVCDSDMHQSLGFSRCKVYFVHYVYHTTNEINEVTQYHPEETDWINNVPYSDERHWSNMGFEVLPDTTQQWSSDAALAQPKPYQAPTFAPGGPLK